MKTLRVSQDFPLLAKPMRGHRLAYLDNAASTQKPRQVIQAMTDFYENDYANVHRGVYQLSERATLVYEGARVAVQKFLHAKHPEEIIFTKGATEALNLLASSFAKAHLRKGDEIILSQMEHHSNIVPWQLLQAQYGVVLKVIPITQSGDLDMLAYEQLFSVKTKLVSVTWVSNVLGTVNPVEKIMALAKAHGVPVCLDSAQVVGHFPVDVQALGCDFLIFSGHKMYGPTGVGVLYGQKSQMDALPPYQGGGEMIRRVSFEGSTFAESPQRFEAGTPPIVEVVGLAAAVKYLLAIGMEKIQASEHELLSLLCEGLQKIPGLRLIGSPKKRSGLVSFVLEGIHPHDVATVLDQQGVAVRAGHHCAMPLMEFYQVPATVRASLGVYNTPEDIDQLIAALTHVRALFS